MRKFFTYLKAVLIALPVIFFYGIRHARYIHKGDKIPFEKKYSSARKEVMFVAKLFHPDFRPDHLEYLTMSNKPQLIIANHYSLLDPLLYIMVSEKPITFVSKKENLKIPFVGQVMKMLGSYTIDRKDLMSQARTLIQISKDLSVEGNPSCVIYIEGTRNHHPEGEPLEFHPGTLKIAYKANCPIVLVSTFGSHRVFDIHSYCKTYPLHWRIHAPINSEEYSLKNTTDLAVELHNQMNEDLKELRKLDRNAVLCQKLSKRRKRLETRVDIA